MISTADSVWTERLLRRRTRWSIYALLFLAALLVRLACFTGLIASDDLIYSYFGQLLAHGTYNLRMSHMQFRLGLIVPLATSYALFGVHELSTVLSPLLASAASVPLLAAIGRRLVPAPAAMLAALLLTTFPVHVHYATVLVPEPVMEFWALAGFLAYLVSAERGGATFGFLAGLCFAVSYLTKEPGLFVAAALILYSVLRRQWKLAAAISLALAFVMAGELLGYFLKTGDMLFRPHVIAYTQTDYAAKHPEIMPYRILKEYPREMLLPNLDFGVHSIAALVLAAAGALLITPKTVWLLAAWMVVPFLYLNFGSSSLTHYVVVPAAPRYIGMVYAPVFLLAGAALHRLFAGPPLRRLLSAAIFLLVAFVGFSCAFATRGQGYRTSAVAGLRKIEQEAARNHQITIRFYGNDRHLWRCVAVILSNPEAPPDCNDHRCLAVQSDALGLPFAQLAPEPNPVPKLSEPCWPE